ncbi:type II secretion system F family protein [Microlunatus sp. Gsoil 973]|uniref:type II secretion system F family protein n=1 Tax=Microlunatus sp. Gsoil 973 TaxID=2672569 RepID=UPI0012B488FC|nr:type II secretion system F family protein [Microlunatus sp. Gsoil 973]QGN33307.1 type II secretion system protein F [Microlunatus sp. Gsoil 973]
MTETFAGLPPSALVAAGLFTLGLLILFYLIIAPGPQKLSWRRRRPSSEPEPGILSRTADGMMHLIVRVIGTRGAGGAELLEEAGIHRRWQEFAALLVIGTVFAGALGLLLGGIPLALIFAITVPLVTRLWLGARIRRRQRAFADQLEDSLQLLSSSLRAGHSMLQALNSVAREAEAPTSEEFTRIINQTRVGREVSDALEDTSRRMQSDDFGWVTQAIAINREVGGNLAEVLDAVGATIRERAQIRGQVKSLAAEGKISAYVLIALPLGVAAFLLLTQPAYLAPFTSSLLGYGLIGVSAVMMIAGTLWLRKVITIKF